MIILILVIVNVIFSYKGFISEGFLERYEFEVDRILINRDFKRIITSGFLHVSWMHLAFNMFSLYAFSGILSGYLGGLQFLLIYFASLIGGNLLSLLVHKNHGDYSSVGASGAVCGVIFASIALFPDFSISLFGILSLPSWLYGIAYVLFALYAIKSRKDNIGHEAHLGGALIGMAFALILEPTAFAQNYITILLIAVPTIAFIYLIITRPGFLLVDNYFFNTHRKFTLDNTYNIHKIRKQEEVDKILEKITRNGLGSLSRKEKKILEVYSKGNN